MPSPVPLLLLLLLPTLTLANDPVLLFAQSSVFQFTVGTTMPIAMDKKGGLSTNLGYQFNYALPWNSSQFEPMVVHARSSRQVQQQQQASLDLPSVYASLEDMLERYGWGDARQCMLRTICELAEAPLHRRGYDAVEDIIHLLLTPSEEGEVRQQDDRMHEYDRAEILGRSRKGECAVAYEGCLGSPLDSFTELAL